MKNLDKFKIGNKEVISLNNGDEYTYKLVSFIAREKKAYDYYNRKKDENEFTKNDEEKIEGKPSTYSLENISGNIIALYYYCEKLDKDNINNNNNDNLPQTNPSSVNGDSQISDVKNISVTNNFIFGNINNGNPNINGIQIRNDLRIGLNNNLNNINTSSDNNMNRNSHSQNQIPRISPHNNNNNDRNSSSSNNVRNNSDNNNRFEESNPRK